MAFLTIYFANISIR